MYTSDLPAIPVEWRTASQDASQAAIDGFWLRDLEGRFLDVPGASHASVRSPAPSASAHPTMRPAPAVWEGSFDLPSRLEGARAAPLA